MDTELTELVTIYRTEAAEQLAAMERSLLALESGGSADRSLINAVMRAAHTLKGNSAIVGYDAATHAAHALEDTMLRLQSGAAALTPALVTDLLHQVDALGALIRAMPDGPAVILPGAAAPAAAHAVAAAAPAAVPADGDATQNATLRVNVARLDQLLSLTGEVAIARGRLADLVGERGDGALATTLDRLEQLHAELQDAVMDLRLVSLGPVLNQQKRTVRDVARQRGRQARLVIEGDDVEVDTRVAEQIKDPLTHMIRNAVDHGLELPAERAERGKDPVGTITLSAAHHAGAVVITLSDDGRGLDRDRIAARAQALGFASDAAALSDEALFAFIFEPGFSTAAAVTEVSGRGVGMDVVRRKIHALRGTVSIASVPGRGTTFTIRLPLTVAIIDGFTVTCGGERYVLPLEAVEECLDFASATAREGLVDLRGRALPFVHLSELLGHPLPEGGRASVVVVRDGMQRAGLVVERLEGSCQAVIKPMSGILHGLPGVAASTILGSGRVALILDITQIVARAAERRAA